MNKKGMFSIFLVVLFSLSPLAGAAQKTATGWYKEGVGYFKAGNYDLALESLTKSIEIDPAGNPDAYFYRAKTYESLGQHEKATTDFFTSCEMGSAHCAEVVPGKLVDLKKLPKGDWAIGDFGYHIDSEGTSTYGPGNAVDGRPETAWVTRDDPSFIFEDMMIGFTPSADTTINRFTIRNGYCKSMDIWKKNSRVKKVAVIINGKPVGAFELKDTIDEQTFSFGKDYSLKDGDVVSFLILETYPGTNYNDIAISELHLDYDIETPYVPMFRGSLTHTGAYDQEGVPVFHKLKWKFKTENKVCSSPSVVDGVVYVGSYDNYLYAIDVATGTMKWRFDAGYCIDSSPAIVDGVVYVGSDDGNLYAVDMNTGKKLWRFSTRGRVKSSPCVVDGVVYFGSSDKYLYAVDKKTAQRLWRFETGYSIRSSPTVVDGVVYFGSNDHNFYAVDIKKGKELWRFETKHNVGSSPCVVDGVVYFGSIDRNLYALDTKSGQELWRFNPDYCAVDSSPSVVDGVVYVGSNDNCLHAIDASTGEEKWHFKTGGHVDSSPSVVDSVVYVGSDDHYLYAIDASTGEMKWRFETGGLVSSSPSVVDGVVYVGSGDGYLYAIE
jgi:outer membrane protein assembly factor BamB